MSLHPIQRRIANTVVFVIFTFISMGGCVTPKPVGESQIQTPIATPTNNSMVHTKGLQIVDGNNKPIKLRGVILEGWLMWNGPLWGAGMTSETKITNRLEAMAGKSHTDKFRTAIYENYITEKDIETIAGLGLNVVRVPFNHTVFEDSNPLENYTARGWKYIDNLLDWCERHKVYVVLDFHSVPGGQGAFVSDPELINVWHNPKYQERTVEIWGAIAKRYANRKIIAGYDLINEPDPPKGKDLIDLNRRIINEIRKVDPLHMIILEGSQFSSDFSMYITPLDANQVYSFHSYNFFTNDTDQANLLKLATIAKAHNVPLWNGEFGAHNAKWIKEEVALYENPQYHVSGWIFWPWKRVSENSERFRDLAAIRPSEEWKQMALSIADLFGPNKNITQEMAIQAMNNFIELLKGDNLVIDEEIKEILTNSKNTSANIEIGGQNTGENTGSDVGNTEPKESVTVQTDFKQILFLSNTPTGCKEITTGINFCEKKSGMSILQSQTEVAHKLWIPMGGIQKIDYKMANSNPNIAVQLISEIRSSSGELMSFISVSCPIGKDCEAKTIETVVLPKGAYYLVTKSAEADKKWMGNLGLKGSIATESSIERIK
ncbi:MAG: cellulase family glycosylhydrolase [Maribacter sp.]|uniref:glycoside hydrolase family 5 protein n=1 Tax=Maribacter sp. TaxID=1897614 RepID=UPI003C74B519